MKDPHNNTSRRDLFRIASLASLAGGALDAAPDKPGKPGGPKAASMFGVPFERREQVRLGVIGVGGRGNVLIDNFIAMPEVRLTAMCDVVRDKLLKTRYRLERAGKLPVAPALYGEGDHAFEQLVKRDDLDLIVVATPWVWHVPMAVAAMKAGKHVGLEVPAARTIDDCWQLVNTSEVTRRHCVQLENCCYGYNELLVLNMCRDGLFGDLTHGACAYNHDLRGELFSNAGEGLWRRFEGLSRNGNLYPTHGLGPVAHYMNINRGERFEYLVSMSSLPAGMAAYRKEHLPADDPRQKEVYGCGDLNVSLIRTNKGRVIQLEHNTFGPQPYDRINLIAGSKGIFRDYPARIYVDGTTPEEFGTIDPYKEKYEHPYWKEIGELARKLGGHGGMDFVMAYRLVKCMREGLAPDIDVYDAVTWSAPGPLSETSVAKGSAPVPFPDFTRGKWRQERPVLKG